MAKVLVGSDLHLDSRLRGVERADDLFDRFDEMVDVANTEDVQLGICCGDLFDGHSPDERVWTLLSRMRGSLGRSTVPWVFVAGNHDVVDRKGCRSALAPLASDMVHVSETVEVVSFEYPTPLHVLTLPHISRAHLTDPGPLALTPHEWIEAEAHLQLDRFESGELSGPLIAAGHLSLPEVEFGSEQEMMRGEMILFPQCVLDSPLVRIMVNGHYHKPQRVGRVIIPGSPERMSFGERSDGKSFLVLEV